MADNKKYYYMRLKENFFDDESMKLLEAMPDGYLYSNILLKMYLSSLKTEGRLMMNGIIPYSPEMIAAITRHQVGTVEKALEIFTKMGLIDVLDNGAIYMLNIQNFIGKSSTEADRKRQYRLQIDDEKNRIGTNVQTNVRHISDKSTPEIEKEIEKEIEINTSSGKSAKFTPPTIEEVDAYCIKQGHEYVDPEEFVMFYESKGWMVGDNKMVSWRSAVGGWNTRSKNRGDKKFKRKPKQTEEPEEEMTVEEWERMVDETY